MSPFAAAAQPTRGTPCTTAQAVRIDVVEPVGAVWEILRSSHTAQRVDAHTFRFDVPVAARGATKVTYTVRVRWC
jgi:hypothetical protein